MMNELITAVEAMNPENLAYAIVTSAAILALIVISALIRYLMQAIGYSKMYRKAGVAGWKAFIPVFNTYNNYKIAWNGKLFFLYAALSIASTILGVYTEGFLAMAANAVSLGVIYMAFKQHTNMAKAFGKGTGTGIALIFFPGITSLILGLGKAEYLGEKPDTN